MAYMPTAVKDYLAMRARGYTRDAITQSLGISKTTQLRWEKAHSAALMKARAAARDEIARELRITREHRLGSLVATYQAIEAELRNRDLAEVPTERLLKAKLEYERSIGRVMATVGTIDGYETAVKDAETDDPEHGDRQVYLLDTILAMRAADKQDETIEVKWRS